MLKKGWERLQSGLRFFFFGRHKKPLRRSRFSTRDEIMEKAKLALMAIPQSNNGISAL